MDLIVERFNYDTCESRCIWTDDGVRLLHELVAGGLSNEQIAKRFNFRVTSHQVREKRRVLGIHAPRENPWTPERIEKLLELWGHGYSASQCAKMIGGVTRNAVIGKAHRLGLSDRKTVRRSAPKPRPKRARKDREPSRPKVCAPVIAETALPPEPVTPDRLYSLTEITEREEAERVKLCRFIYGDTKGIEPWGYCGCVSAPGSSYCAGHHNVVWRSLEVKRTLDRKPMFVCTTRFGHAKEVAV